VSNLIENLNPLNINNPYQVEFLSGLAHPNAASNRMIELRRRYSYAIPSYADGVVIANHAPRIVEVGAGTGYWGYFLSQFGVDIICYDPEPYQNRWCRADRRFYEVERGDVRVIDKHQDRALLLCWPPYNNRMAFDALNVYQGDTVVYIGEGSGMACASDAFFEALSTQFVLDYEHEAVYQWRGIYTELQIWKR
jgi:hypothetical protein